MAEYYVDKIKYSGNIYKLLDNGALHTNGILTGTTGTFAADKGIFNKLIATSADIGTLDVNNLTAQNAKVLGLLDVQGELHTNKWTNANISNIGGSFYISPTVSTTIATGNTPMSITIGGSANARTFAVSGGSFVTDAVKIYNGSTTTTASWAVGSHVMVTGSIRVGTNGVDYPLGTLTGYLTVALATGGFTVGEISSTALETIITEVGTSNLKSYDIKISMFEIGPKTTLKPVGIMMTSYGVDKSTYLDIYGGVNQKNSSTGAVNPNLRIGYLGGLPGFTVNSKTTVTPSGWGIYTDNGFFKGVIAATSGIIGNFTLTSTALYSGSHSAYNTSGQNGIFISDEYVSGGPGAKWWLKSDGSAQIGAMTLTAAGVLTVPAANVSGTLTAATIDASKVSTGDIAAARIQTNLISAINAKVSDLSALTATIGGFAIDTSSIHTNGVAVTSNADNSIGLSSADFTRTINNVSRTGLRFAIGDKFGVTGDGMLYAANADITGDITATSFSAKADDIIRTQVTSDGLLIYDEDSNLITTIGEDAIFGNTTGNSGYLQITNSGLSLNGIRIDPDDETIRNPVELASFSSEGITFRTLEGLDALDILTSSTLVNKTITKNSNIYCKLFVQSGKVSAGSTVTCTTTIGTSDQSSITVSISEFKTSKISSNRTDYVLTKPSSGYNYKNIYVTKDTDTTSVTLATKITLSAEVRYYSDGTVKVVGKVKNANSSGSYSLSNATARYVYAASIKYTLTNVPMPIIKSNGYIDTEELMISGTNVTSPTYTYTDIVPYSSRCTRVSGGVYKIGKWRFLRIQIKISTALSANNYWTVLQGLDAPANNMGAAFSAAITAKNGGVLSSYLTTGGLVYLVTSSVALAANDIVNISGWYIAQ